MMLNSRTGGLSLLAAAALLSGCSLLKHKNESPVVDSGAITQPAKAGDTSRGTPIQLAATDTPSASYTDAGDSRDPSATADSKAAKGKSKKGKTGNDGTSGATVADGAGLSGGSGSPRTVANGSIDLPSDTGVIHFAFDEYELSSDDIDALTTVAAYLKAHPTVTVELFGHTDERGTTNYNLALGERRGQAAETFLRTQGVAGTRIEVVSYGESKPAGSGHDENAWAKNRRVEMVLSDGGRA